ncbi:MAG: hypothetical protein E7812_05100 [Phenylobacterium sp.]|nr:MAG: hypothetical protein E7812_05100 [Phenylobacterium sp.]
MRPGGLAVVAALAMAAPAQAAQAQDQIAPTDAPKVIGTFPPSGSLVPAGIGQIQVTYDRPMMDKSWSFTTGGEQQFPEVDGGPVISDDHRTFSLAVKLQPNSTYVVWMNSGHYQNFKDEQGRSATPYRLTFKTSE